MTIVSTAIFQSATPINDHAQNKNVYNNEKMNNNYKFTTDNKLLLHHIEVKSLFRLFSFF